LSILHISPLFLKTLFSRNILLKKYHNRLEYANNVYQHSTGYGLYIAKKVTEAHGGTIRAESAGEGKGTTFTAAFPVEPI